MTKTTSFAVYLACVASFAFAAPKGTVARSTALTYPAHAEQDGVATGALLLTSQETRKDFVSDLNRCCVVVEFALYPQTGQPVAVSLNDFSLRTIGTDTQTRAASAKIVSATLQKKAASSRDVAVSPSVGIGYESGTFYDPSTGQPRRGGGVYTQTGVGIGISPPGGQGGATDADRKVMEVELDEKGLPEGAATTPVAGYLYFPYFPLSKKAKNARYELEYTVNGKKVVLRLAE
jgi:hypothetical protein